MNVGWLFHLLLGSSTPSVCWSTGVLGVPVAAAFRRTADLALGVAVVVIVEVPSSPLEMLAPDVDCRMGVDVALT